MNSTLSPPPSIDPNVVGYTSVMLSLTAIVPFLYELLYFIIVALVHRHYLQDQRYSAYNWFTWCFNRGIYYLNDARDRVTTLSDYFTRNVATFTTANMVAISIGTGSALLYCYLHWLVAICSMIIVYGGIVTGLWNGVDIKLYWVKKDHWSILRRCRIITCGLLMTGLAVSICIVLPLLSKQVAEMVRMGSKWPRIAGETSEILLIYMIVPVIHLLQAMVGFRSVETITDGIFHICNFAYGISRFVRIAISQGDIDRLHHDILGLFLTIFPINSVRFIGILYIIDSILYEVWYTRKYDFSNVVVDHIGLIIGIVLINSIFQAINWLFLDRLLTSIITTPQNDSEEDNDDIIA